MTETKNSTKYRHISIFDISISMYAVLFFEWSVLLVVLQGHVSRTLLEHRTLCMIMCTLSNKILMAYMLQLEGSEHADVSYRIGLTSLTDHMHFKLLDIRLHFKSYVGHDLYHLLTL